MLIGSRSGPATMSTTFSAAQYDRNVRLSPRDVPSIPNQTKNAAQAKNLLIKEREEERRKADAAKHEEEVTKYKKINEQLKTNLEAMLSAPQRS